LQKGQVEVLPDLSQRNVR